MGSTRKPSSRDVEISLELAKARKSAGLSQAELAARLRISTQQVGKYERGENRIPSGRLEQIQDIIRGEQGSSSPGFAEVGAPYRAAESRKAESDEALLMIWKGIEKYFSVVGWPPQAKKSRG